MPPITVMVIIIIIKVAVVIMVMITVAVIITAAVVMAPGKGSKKNPQKFFPRKKRRFPSGLLMRDGARVRVISILINILPLKKGNEI